jgi:hypothetical protein
MNHFPCQNEVYIQRAIDFCKNEELAIGRRPEEVYMCGNCGNLYRHLKSVFHCARPIEVLKGGHVITKIGALLCDVTGTWGDYGIKHKFMNDDDIKTLCNNYTESFLLKNTASETRHMDDVGAKLLANAEAIFAR